MDVARTISDPLTRITYCRTGLEIGNLLQNSGLKLLLPDLFWANLTCFWRKMGISTQCYGLISIMSGAGDKPVGEVRPLAGRGLVQGYIGLEYD